MSRRAEVVRTLLRGTGQTLITVGLVLLLFWLTDIGYLWFNIIGCGLVMGLAALLSGRARNAT